MTTLFVRHTVADYKTWRKAPGEKYDAFAPIQKAKGITAQAVTQSADNPNDITITHDFLSLEAAKAFTTSDELKQAMQSAGVVGAPTFWFTSKV